MNFEKVKCHQSRDESTDDMAENAPNVNKSMARVCKGGCNANQPTSPGEFIRTIVQVTATTA